MMVGVAVIVGGVSTIVGCVTVGDGILVVVGGDPIAGGVQDGDGVLDGDGVPVVGKVSIVTGGVMVVDGRSVVDWVSVVSMGIWWMLVEVVALALLDPMKRATSFNLILESTNFLPKRTLISSLARSMDRFLWMGFSCFKVSKLVVNFCWRCSVMWYWI